MMRHSYDLAAADARTQRLRSLRVWGQDVWLSERAHAIWPDGDILTLAAEIRDEIRRDKGANDYEAIAWEIAMVCGYPVMRGVVVTDHDEAIARHSWNVLPGGYVLDIGRDRFGWSTSEAIVDDSPNGLLAYRPEWSSLQTPEKAPPVGWGKQSWLGEYDAVTLAKRSYENIDGWWCKTPASLAILSGFRQKMANYRAGAAALELDLMSSPLLPTISPSMRP